MPKVWFWFSFSSAVLLLSCRSTSQLQDVQTARASRLEPVGYVQVEPDLRLYYRVLGSGSDTLLIPYHGVPAFERLARGRTVIIYDRRHMGASDPVDSARLGIEFDLRDIEAVRQGLGLGRFALLGQSYMAALALRYAADHPEHVSRVVAFAPPPIRSETWRALPRPKPRADSLVVKRLEELRRAGRDTLDPAGFCREQERLELIRLRGDTAVLKESAYDRCAHPNEWGARRAIWLRRIPRSFGTWDWRSQAQRVEAPVLLIWGTADPATAVEGATEWLEHLPDARLLPISGAEHSVWNEHPEFVVGAVERFLSGSWPHRSVRRYDPAQWNRGSSAVLPNSARERLLGAWELVSIERYDPDGKVGFPYGDQPLGLITYDASGRMSAHVVRRDRQPFRTPRPVQADTLGFIEYFGTFEVNEQDSTVTHHVHGSLYPEWIGTKQQRRYRFKDDRLHLWTVRPASGATPHLVATWKRARYPNDQ